MKGGSVREIAQEFWRGLPFAECFPRDIEKAIALKLPLALVKLPSIDVLRVREYLEARGVSAQLPSDRRKLMGCLVAFRGKGIVFVSGADPQEEQRLTIAHETGHFLRDYLVPRQQIITALGGTIAEVLDGERTATTAERVNAVLAHVRVGAHVHLLPRRSNRGSLAVADAEVNSDVLGLELLAPHDQVRGFVGAGIQRNACSDEIVADLSGRYGAPQSAFFGFLPSPASRRVVSFLQDIRPAFGGCQHN
jgi:hypothetical protein